MHPRHSLLPCYSLLILDLDVIFKLAIDLSFNMARALLPSLPTEVLRHICGILPCSSALNILLVCRAINQACDDWTAWREVMLQIAGNLQSSIAACSSARDGWKRYVVAMAANDRRKEPISELEMENWIPQLAALRCLTILPEDHFALRRLYQTAAPNIAIPDGGDGQSSPRTWLLAQVSAFALSMQYLVSTTSAEASIDGTLFSIPWNFPVLPGPEWREAQKVQQASTAEQHALANRAVGLFYLKIRTARETVTSSVNFQANLFAEPPSAASIPLSEVMRLPLPFTQEALRQFSQCHVPTMAEPTFLTDREWTGYFGIRGEGHCALNGVGGEHIDGHNRVIGSIVLDPPPGTYPYGRNFEGIIRFRTLEENVKGILELESNNFHTKGGLHKLFISLCCETGLLNVTRWHPLYTQHAPGVMTPFGIVACFGQGCAWMWLWPKDWCRNEEYS